MNGALARRGIAETYRVVDVNLELTRVYYGDTLIGQVRRGLDRRWNPELPDKASKVAAVQSVVIAHQAIEEFMEVADGSR